MKLTNKLYFYPEQGLLDSNTYVIKGNPSVIIDPGSAMFLPALIDGLRKDGIDPKDIGIIANTHLHADHCSANKAFKDLSGASITLHSIQDKFYEFVFLDSIMAFGLPADEFREGICLEDNALSLGNAELELMPSPGHSPDCVCFYDRSDKILICGDVIFERNTGRVDLPGGSADELKKSIEKLSQLDIEFLLPGHMGIVSGAEKVKQNFNFIREYVFKWL
jgi:hydroxyacylglutathione hydrolase